MSEDAGVQGPETLAPTPSCHRGRGCGQKGKWLTEATQLVPQWGSQAFFLLQPVHYLPFLGSLILKQAAVEKASSGLVRLAEGATHLLAAALGA